MAWHAYANVEASMQRILISSRIRPIIFVFETSLSLFLTAYGQPRYFLI